MPLRYRPPNGDDTLVEYVAFPNDGGGYGFGQTEQGYQTRLGYNYAEGYDRTINMTVRNGKSLSPSFAPNLRSTAYNSTHFETYPPSFLVPWVDANGVPMTLFALFIAAWKFKDGAIASETDATTETYASACLHADGTVVSGGTPDAPFMYAGTFSTTTGAAQFLNKRSQGGSWTESGTVRAKYVTPAAGALWRTYNTNDVTKEPIYASKCPAGSDPMTLANWGAGFLVGTADSKITAMAAIGAAPVICKEDGVYAYNEVDARFERIHSVPHHPNNFPTLKPNGAGGLYTISHSGAVVDIQQFGAVVVATPLKNKWVGRDTPAGPIQDIVPFEGKVIATTLPAYRLMQPSGMKVYKTADTTNWSSPGTFTDGTANVTDFSSTTVLNLNSLDTLANGDAILIGFDDQFLGFNFSSCHPPGAAEILSGTGPVMLVEFSTAAGTFSTMNIVDGTARWSDASSTHRSMHHAGTVAFKPSTDISTWVKATYNSQSKYWVRISFSAALTSDCEVAEVAIIQRRGAPNFGTTNNNNAYVWEASGMFGKVLVAERRGDTLVWDDTLTLLSVSGAGKNANRSPGSNKITVSSQGTANSLDTSLVVACHDEFYQYPLPYLDDPTLTAYPVLARDTANTCPPVFYPSAIETGGLHRLRFVEVYGKNLTKDVDSLAFSYKWDETGPWYVTDKRLQSYALWSINDDNVGTVFHSAIQLLDSVATDPIGPSIDAIVYWFEEVGEDRPLELDRVLPEIS